jgi:type II secretory pathway pseudopilin PulG
MRMKNVIRKLKISKAITLVEVLVSIVLTSIILLSMTKVTVLVLRNSIENEMYDQAIQEFSKAEERFKSWYITQKPDPTNTELKSFCSIATGKFLNLNSSSFGELAAGQGVSVDFSGSPKRLIASTRNTNILIGLEVTRNQNYELEATSYVNWQINGKKYYFTNNIYLYTGEKCAIMKLF